jgi:hypothetical protein
MRARELILAAAVLAVPSVASAGGMTYGGGPYVAGDNPGYVLFSGGEVAKNSWEAYDGGIFALNRNITTNGVLIRAMGSYGKYEYTNNTPGPNTEHDGRMLQGDLMLGYQWVTPDRHFALYAGVDHIDHHISPADITNPVSGNETGFKVAWETESNRSLPFYYALEGSYSTAFDTYYVLGRLGANRNGLIIGPEAWALGDETGNATRLGAFLSFNTNLIRDHYSEVTLSAGYQWVDPGPDNCGTFFGSEGAYATLNFAIYLGGDRGHVPLK